MKRDRKLIGHVGIDSGQIVLIDPAYVDAQWKPRDRSGEYGGGTYSECCRLTESPDLAGQLKFQKGHDGLGVVTATGYGDGSYPVFVDYVDDPKLGRRIKRILVEFLR